MTPVSLGAFAPVKAPIVEVVQEEPREDRLAELLVALQSLTSPAPPALIIEPPDLTDIVTAVTSLKPGPTAAEIAAAIADVIRPGPVQDVAPLREVAEALRNLDFRMKGMGTQAYGGGSSTLAPGQTIGVSGSISVANQLIPTAFDEIVLTYTGSNVTGVVYKQSGNTVATLTLTYSGTNITRVVRT